MIPSIDKRLAALVAEIERRRQIQEEPLDTLSASLYDFADELRQLDVLGRAALLEELNRDGDIFDDSVGCNLTTDKLDEFIRDFTKKPHILLTERRTK